MRGSSIWRLVQLLPAYRTRVLGVVTLSLLAGALSAVVPYLFKTIVDAVIISQRPASLDAGAQLVSPLCAYAGLRYLIVALNHWQSRQADTLWLATVAQVRERTFGALDRRSMNFFERTSVGGITQQFSGIVPISMWLQALVQQNLANIVLVCALVITLTIRSPHVGALMAIVVIGSILLSWRSFTLTTPMRGALEGLVGQLFSALSEFAANIATVRSLGCERVLKDRFDSTQSAWRVNRESMNNIARNHAVSVSLLETTAMCACVGWVVWGAFGGDYTAGDIVFVLTISASLMSAVVPITYMINQAADAEASAQRLMELIDGEDGNLECSDALELDTVRSIRFENVSFSYASTGEVLKEASFTLRQGEAAALVGASGAGKSTLIKLLLRQYEPTSGRILVNERDISLYSRQSLIARFGVVLQGASLFHRTIEENIALAKPGSTADDIRQAATLAHAQGFIDRLPDGFGTVVGERGASLSGGEVQRIAIARAFLRAPDVLIWDEATSALDPASEECVLRSLRDLSRGRLAIVATHRQSTVAAADTRLIVDEGRVIEQRASSGPRIYEGQPRSFCQDRTEVSP